MANPEIVQDFYGVYLLYNINPKYKGRTYIGYTRDPNRRIMQHNRGTWAGGAHRTSNRGPWKMVMIVHGFPNNISALRFEWAWQNPNKTTRLQHLDLKKIPRKETEFQFKLRVLSEMLRVGPWCRLPLVIRWLENDFKEEFPSERKPPEHMTICQGPVKSYNRKSAKEITSDPTRECLLCSGYLNQTEQLSCLNVNCDMISHMTCLANLFLPPGEYIPISGHCPFCNTKLKWGDLIRKMNGYDPALKDCDRDKVEDNETVYTQDVDNDEVVCTQDRVFVDNFDDDVICTQDNTVVTKDDSDEYNCEVTCTQDRIFVNNFNDSENDDVVCTQVDTVVTKDDSDEYNCEVTCTQDRIFVNNFNDSENDDVVCTQVDTVVTKNDCDEYNCEVTCTQDRIFVNNFNDSENDDVVCTQVDTVVTKDDCDEYNCEIACAQDRVLANNFNDYENDDVVCTQVETAITKDDSDEDDHEAVFKPLKVYDDHPSWFLDCNEDL